MMIPADPATTPEQAVRDTILIVTDSLGFPRAEPELVRYEQTYIARLRAAFPQYDIVHYGQGGATIDRLYANMSYYSGTINPRFCFIQSGIVDCAPRALKEVELQILKRLPLIGAPTGRLIQRNAAKIRRYRKLQYTPLDQFRACVTQFEQLFARTWWITIPSASAAYEATLPGIGVEIDRYNAVLRSRNHIDCSDFEDADMMSDHHHLGVRGHRRLSDRIVSTIVDQESATTNAATVSS